MSTFNFTRSYQLNHAPIVGSGPQENSSQVVQGVYSAISEGVLDIPSGAATGATFSIPFGGITAPKSVLVVNQSATGSVSVELQGDGVAQGVELPPGAALDIASPTAPGSKPLTQIAVAVVASEPGLGQIAYIILG